MTWRYHLQRALSNEWIDRDAQLSDVTVNWSLSGPGEVSAKIDAAFAGQVALDGRLLYDEWSTLLYIEKDDVIRWGGILKSSADAGNGDRTLVFTSFSGYAHGRIWLALLQQYYEADAFDIIRLLWTWLQTPVPGAGNEINNGNLDVTLSQNDSGYVLGSPDPGPKPVKGPSETVEAFEARTVAWQSKINEPYELAWWNTIDIGAEIDNIMTECGGEYVEQHWWEDEDKTEVRHHIELYVDGAGSRRDDLRFVEGENVMPAPQPDRDGDAFANYVRGIGAGSDRDTLFEEQAVYDGRLRRDFIAPLKGTYRPSLLKALVQETMRSVQDIMSFDSIDVLDHPNAAVGSWQLGDEIFVKTHSGFEQINDWVRITGWSIKPGTSDIATIEVMRLI